MRAAPVVCYNAADMMVITVTNGPGPGSPTTKYESNVRCAPALPIGYMTGQPVTTKIETQIITDYWLEFLIKL